MFNADICLDKPCRLVAGPCDGGGPALGTAVSPLPFRTASSYRGCRGVAVIWRRNSLSSWSRTEDGGRGSELLLRRPACHAFSSADVCGSWGCGEGAGSTLCDEGLRILMEELRTLCEFDLDGFADGVGGFGAGCGADACEVVVTVGLVMVVD